MNWILKKIKINKKTIFIGLFLVGIFISMLFLNVKNSSAALINGQTPKTGSCIPGNTGIQQVNNETECTAICVEKGLSTGQCSYHPNSVAAEVVKVNDVNVNKNVQGDDSNIFEIAIKKLLIGVLNFVGWLFAVAATLFAWAIEPANISGETGVLNKQAVRDVWIMVRDVLNMTFILVLLFAAFCTIFQVDKWNLKKVWLNILINALLVNFSYPIARFFIDVSNVAFYYFVNHLFSTTGTVTGSTIFASFGASSMVSEILAPGEYSQYPIASLLAMIVVVFIMGMTLLVIAALFIVRLMVLTILVMFSPIGFVGYIFPSTAKHADDWWKQLFSYSFFAPIMIFIVAVSLRITEALGRENFQSFKANASVNASSGNQANFVAQLAFFSIPVVLLWMGIGIAKSMGIKGADEVVNRVKKGGNWLATRPWAAGKYAWKQSGVPGGVKKGIEEARKSGKLFGSEKLGWILKDGREGREAGWSGFMDNGAKGYSDAIQKRRQDANKEKIEKGAKGIVDGGATVDTLAADMIAHFGVANPNANDKIKHARTAAAYLKQDAAEREFHIKDSLSNAGAANYQNTDSYRIINQDLSSNFTGANAPAQIAQYQGQQIAARQAAQNIANGRGRKQDHQAVLSFTNKQMKHKISEGAKS